MSSLVRLAAGDTEAAVDPMGAELRAWRVAGRDLLWASDPAVWPRTSPVLFPIVGRVRGGVLRVGGRPFAMGIHGFAALCAFAVVERAAASVRLRLCDDAATRAAFPFAFRLDVAFRLAAGRLAVDFEVGNPGSEPLPYALGWHPGFAWPFAGGPRDGYAVVFGEEERPEVPVITADGLFSPRRRPVPVDGRRLPVNDALLANEALCFLDARSRSLRFEAPGGTALRLELQDFPHIALWSRPPAPFLCIEAWTGHGDPEDFAGDVAAKPSMRFLAPGASARHALRLAVEVPR